MTRDYRITFGLIADVLDVLDRHGYACGDDLHADRAIGLIGGPARICEGTQGHPAIACLRTVPPSSAAYPGSGRHGAVNLTRDDASAVFAAPEIAADSNRYRAKTCPGYPAQSCPTRLQDAWTFCQMAVRTLPVGQAVPAASASQPAPDHWFQPADREASQ